MCEDDVGIDLADHGNDAFDQFGCVVDGQVVHEARVEAGAEQLRATARFPGADPACGLDVMLDGAMAAVGDRHVVGLPTGIAEQQQRAAGDNLDVVRVGHEGEGAPGVCGRVRTFVHGKGRRGSGGR